VGRDDLRKNVLVLMKSTIGGYLRIILQIIAFLDRSRFY